MDEDRRDELIQWVIDQKPHCERCGGRLTFMETMNWMWCEDCPGDTVHPFGYIVEQELRDAFIQEFGEEEWEDFIYVEPPDEFILDYNDPEDIVYGPTFDGVDEDDVSPLVFDCCDGCEHYEDYEEFPDCSINCLMYQEWLEELGEYEIRYYQEWLDNRDNDD